MLSGSASGAVVIKDSVTRREIRVLNHACAGRGVSMMVYPHVTQNESILTSPTKAYHVSDGRWRIATVGRGPSATINVWTGERRSRVQVSDTSGGLRFKLPASLLVGLRSLSAEGTCRSHPCCRIGRTFTKPNGKAR